jgi:riboflavin kinase
LGQLTFRGTVFSGSGAGKHFVGLPWVRVQIEQKLGFTPYPGTLNLHLGKDEAIKRRLLDPALGIRVEPEAGYFLGSLFSATVLGVKAAVVVPLVPDYPADVLEVIAPLYLRGKLEEGGEGERVVVTVTV